LPYFLQILNEGPNVEEFKKWPLSHKAYEIKYRNIPKDPGFLKPKEMH
jgi:hypothetical protein